jgi:hypothetical protein
MIAQLVAGAAKAVRALPDRTDTAVISYQALQALIGILGLALPFVLISVKPFLDGPGIPPSISDYYYTSMRDYFVGSLWAIGIFLSSYRGEKNFHHVFGIIACLCAVGVALFPNDTPRGGNNVGRHSSLLLCGRVFRIAGVFFARSFPGCASPGEGVPPVLWLGYRWLYCVWDVCLCLSVERLAGQARCGVLA